jgi:ABC-type transport system substrate-binding protein
MRDTSSPSWPLPARLLPVGFVLPLLALGLAVSASGGGDKSTPLSRIPLREGQPPSGPAREAPLVLRPADLARAADKAPPAVAVLYRALATPDRDAEPPYEESALKKIEDFLKAPAQDLAPLDRLRAAETALAAVLRFHLGARNRPVAGANRWAALEKRLRGQLFDVRRRQLRQLRDAPALALADHLLETYPRSRAMLDEAARARIAHASSRLIARDYPGARRQLDWIEEHFLHDPSFPPPRVTWVYHPGVASIRRTLEARAEALLKQARATPNDAEAAALLSAARAACPRLPGLHDELLRRRHAYTVLYVGVASLPEFLSPATARTDPEKQAVELLFEGLLRERYDDARGERYLAQLAAGEPVSAGANRLRFALDRQARWSNGQRVTSTHVRDTVLRLRSPTLPGRTPEWADLVEPPVIEDDPFRIDFRARQPYFAPLAPLTFKVLPTLGRADDPAFARQPVGSGPYQYAGRRREGDRDCAIFTANPYHVRAGRAEQPYLREIRFYVPTNPAADFRNAAHPLHLLLDLPTGKLTALGDAGVKDIRTLRNRRVYFLALNQRVSALADPTLRRALAHALDRESVLTYRFRGGEPAHQMLAATGSIPAAATLDLRRGAHAQYHRALNGPYPPGSWPCSPKVPANLHDPARARALLREAAAKLGKKPAPLTLTLKYPTGDARVERACRDLAAQLDQLGEEVGWPIHVRPVGLAPRELSEAIEQRNYQLAYYHLDYPSEDYWLWPLFDRRAEAMAKGGANFLGYEDAVLEGLFRAVMSQRDFSKVRGLTHEIHARLHDRMPLIPLWQLDTHVALHPALRPTYLDPLRIFTDVAGWKLEK